MRVELVAPDRMVWAGEAEMVIAKTGEGTLGVLAGHQPLLGSLVEGPVRIRPEGGPGADDPNDIVAAVHGGFISVSDRGVSVLAEVVELADEIDVQRARDALQRAEQDSADEDEEEALAAARRRAQARLRAAGEEE